MHASRQPRRHPAHALPCPARPGPIPAGSRLQGLGALFALTATLALAGCGGGEDGTVTPSPAPPVAPAPPPAPTPPAPTPPAPPPTASTTVGGAVVKGPVSGAQVCAYTVLANARGAALGSCTTSDSTGTYSLSVPAGSGPLWLEATGGSYTDEATAASATLPAGSALTAIVTANGGTVTSMLTPLTTLALNAAAASAGSSGTLDALAYSAAATQLLASFNLPAGLDIGGTLPSFGTGINSYGTALTVISQMVANGLPLATLLSTTQPSTLAAAYAAAAEPPAPPPPPPPTGSGSITATGSVSSTGGVETFVPRAAPGGTTAPFGTSVSTAGGSSAEVYTFTNTIRAIGSGGAGVLATQAFTVTLTRGQLSVFFLEVFADGRSINRFCTLPCSGVTLTPTANGSGVSLSFTNASMELSLLGTSVPNPPTTPVVMNGSLTGDMPGGYAFVSQLPRATTGSLSLDGTAEPVLFAEVGYDGQAPLADRLLFPAVTLSTAQGTLTVSRVAAETPYYFARFVTRVGGENFGLRVTADALVSTPNGYAINLDAATLTASGSPPRSKLVTAQVSVGKASGSVAIGGEGNFVAQLSYLTGNSQSITYEFRAPPGPGGFAFSNIVVTLKAGVVTQFSAATPAGKAYSCDGTGSLFMARCAGTVTVSADLRTLSFNGFRAGATLSPNATISFEGSLTAAGL